MIVASGTNLYPRARRGNKFTTGVPVLRSVSGNAAAGVAVAGLQVLWPARDLYGRRPSVDATAWDQLRPPPASPFSVFTGFLPAAHTIAATHSSASASSLA